ncbi:MAG: anion permease [Deltaproteobacteria bacterium]|nr:anion permease [Deltaproteobacteria bacterium]
MWRLLGGVLIGWGLGSNDSANIFGTGVAANVLKYRTAIVLTAGFVIAGALAEGHKSMHTVGDMSNISPDTAFIATLSAGLCVSVFSYLSLPVSTSQAIIGAVLGIGLVSGIPDLTHLYKVLLCWLFTPFGGMVFSALVYPLLGRIFERFLTNIQWRNIFIKLALLFAGCYGAYSLGANNVANVTGVFVGAGYLTLFQASLIGSLSIAFGVLTYSKKVMDTVGRRIVELDGFSAFVASFSAAITVHFFTQIGVPVSSSQAVVGAVSGVGLIKGARTVSKKTLTEIAEGWISTPLFSGVLSYLMMRIYIAFFRVAG